eukprot:CAMPEP_0177640322 /NCGR_PEP_ID=MMETSP0447-20121125/6482_1 /TAXON_ID=0 /ORGANISM="Stygamoeba regulata, Strain BSH-02190019" /LENGTH=128 /DNA_ID=CAMNT_0019142387 /DNA_START=160 /DNA_END=546 /DNA_ORIENTATION=+
MNSRVLILLAFVALLVSVAIAQQEPSAPGDPQVQLTANKYDVITGRYAAYNPAKPVCSGQPGEDASNCTPPTFNVAQTTGTSSAAVTGRSGRGAAAGNAIDFYRSSADSLSAAAGLVTLCVAALAMLQ